MQLQSGIPSLVGERRALALASLAFFGSIYVVTSLVAPPQWTAVFTGFAVCYWLGFFALAAEWFWGRWFAMGIGWSGLVLAAMSLKGGVNGVLIFYGVAHALVVVGLRGRPAAERYELRPEARERLGLDEAGMERLGKTVTRAAATLPSLVAYALAPRESANVLMMAAILGAALGIHALLRGRSFGLIPLGAAAAASAMGFLLDASPAAANLMTSDWFPGVEVSSVGLAAAFGLTLALFPFAAPVGRFLARPATR